MEKIIPLNIVATYPVRWGRYQVIRDFVQNFYDAVGYSEWKEKFHYNFADNALSIWVDGITFSYEWLLHIGASTKTSCSMKYAGYFGEGFKIASLCAKRDFEWNIHMQSGEWALSVDFVDYDIENQKVKMMAYRINTLQYTNRSTLTIMNFKMADYNIFLDTLESFYYPENKIFGEEVWADENGAVYMRSKEEISAGLPIVNDYGRRGAVFCGYQMLGTNPFGMVVCLHRYQKQDRERRTLYSFEVINVFESIAYYIDSYGAMVMLEKMKRYWNSVPCKQIDIHSWSGVINMLIYKMKDSPEIIKSFVNKYPNLLYQERIHTVAAKNRRGQARSWLSQQREKYVLVKETFRCLGYPSLEEMCEKQGGFVEKEEQLTEVEEYCYDILESVCKKIFCGFFIIEAWPEKRIIRNNKAVYHGMAVVHGSKNKIMNNAGILIKYRVVEIYLKTNIFNVDGYYDGLCTYVHELCHMFGGDSSNSFSFGLTKAMEILMINRQEVEIGKECWRKIFKAF